MPGMAVVFDCDGVLVDGERLVRRIESELFRRWGWDVSPEELARSLEGRGHVEVVEAIRGSGSRMQPAPA
jgi:beta-phosphoglucomutase-like phosphatase (HAD superfamily)